jgi:hypothetical protein
MGGFARINPGFPTIKFWEPHCTKSVPIRAFEGFPGKKQGGPVAAPIPALHPARTPDYKL